MTKKYYEEKKAELFERSLFADSKQTTLACLREMANLEFKYENNPLRRLHRWYKDSVAAIWYTIRARAFMHLLWNDRR